MDIEEIKDTVSALAFLEEESKGLCGDQRSGMTQQKVDWNAVCNEIDDMAHYMKAEKFVEMFPEFVALGIRNRLHLEQKEWDDPSAKQYHLAKMRGWIDVFNIRTTFAGRQHDTDIHAPFWVRQAVDILKDEGWAVDIRKGEISEIGCGNHIYLSVAIVDPRTVAVVSSS